MTASARRAALERAHAEQLAALEQEEAQARLLALPKSVNEALVLLDGARSSERRAPHDYEPILDAIYELLKAIIASQLGSGVGVSAKTAKEKD